MPFTLLPAPPSPGFEKLSTPLKEIYYHRLESGGAVVARSFQIEVIYLSDSLFCLIFKISDFLRLRPKPTPKPNSKQRNTEP